MQRKDKQHVKFFGMMKPHRLSIEYSSQIIHLFGLQKNRFTEAIHLFEYPKKFDVRIYRLAQSKNYYYYSN